MRSVEVAGSGSDLDREQPPSIGYALRKQTQQLASPGADVDEREVVRMPEGTIDLSRQPVHGARKHSRRRRGAEVPAWAFGPMEEAAVAVQGSPPGLLPGDVRHRTEHRTDRGD